MIFKICLQRLDQKMSRKTYRVNGLKIVQIRLLANFFRKKFRLNELPLGRFIELMIAKELVDVLEDNDPLFKNGAEAKYVPEAGCVFLKQSDYDACVRNTSARSKFTFWHEIGHGLLGHSLSFSRGEGIEGRDIPAYESSEWQADQFAAEILMPLEIIKAEKLFTPEALVSRFGVSWEAATVRLKQLSKHKFI